MGAPSVAAVAAAQVYTTKQAAARSDGTVGEGRKREGLACAGEARWAVVTVRGLNKKRGEGGGTKGARPLRGRVQRLATLARAAGAMTQSVQLRGFGCGVGSGSAELLWGALKKGLSRCATWSARGARFRAQSALPPADKLAP